TEVSSRRAAPNPSANAPQKIASSGASNKPAAYKTTIAIRIHSNTLARVIRGERFFEACSPGLITRGEGADFLSCATSALLRCIKPSPRYIAPPVATLHPLNG